MLGDDGRLPEQHLEPVDQEAQVAGRHEPGGLLGDAAVGLPDRLRRLQVPAETGDGLIDGVEELVGDLGLAVGHALGVVLDVGVGGLGPVLLTLLLPAPLLGLDDDERVGGDAVATAQLSQAHLAGDVLALQGAVVTDLVRGSRLRASRPPRTE